MSFDLALRLTEILLALALIQHSAEHMTRPEDRRLFAPRIALALLMLAGIATAWVTWALWGIGLLILRRFDGPYNGGSDKMTLLVLTCLACAHLPLDIYWRELALAYLAVQLALSYFVSGWIKVINPDWRSGIALSDVFRFSAYPVSARLRRIADWRGATFAASWAVMGLELAFPLAVLHPLALAVALTACAVFHLSNACFFGLNRFVWAWFSAFPALLWLQARVV